ncbi:MAG: plasmid pRiA4b ORF-3 family protein [Dermatophilaceae bacterium]
MTQRPEPESISLPDPPAQAQLLTIRLSLDDTKPPVWRRLTIPGDMHLGDVHEVVQTAMGWTDSHLHRFYLGDPWGGPHFVTDYDIEQGEEGVNELDVRLDQLLREPGQKLGYQYDFGDDWAHTLRLEKTAPMPDPSPSAPEGGDAPAYPVECLAGARACPPEDVGGVGGYEEMAAWVRHDFDRAHAPKRWGREDLAGLRDWLPPEWHPDTFSVDEVNDALRRLTPRDPTGALSQFPRELRLLSGSLEPATAAIVRDWLGAAGQAGGPEFTPDEAAELTRPWRTVLDVVGAGLQLTNAGYLPPRTVETIYTTLDLDREWIGKGNREDLTYPVAELREQAQAFGLIRKAKGRLLPTARARAMRDDPVALLEHILGRLTSTRGDFERLATLLTLLAVSAGVRLGRSWGEGEVADEVCRVLASAGWRRDKGPIERSDVTRATRDPVDVLRSMTNRVTDPHAAQQLHRRLALVALRRDDL